MTFLHYIIGKMLEYYIFFYTQWSITFLIISSFVTAINIICTNSHYLLFVKYLNKQKRGLFFHVQKLHWVSKTMEINNNNNRFLCEITIFINFFTMTKLHNNDSYHEPICSKYKLTCLRCTIYLTYCWHWILYLLLN